ncbi:MAG TPA: hypothetical protein VL947_02290, partial [Cytophagales bacterium]|nr:hypothetical protein [Cytophagales bacterium]
MKLYYYLGWIFLFLSLASCKKEEGRGGKLSITGSVLARYFSGNLSKFTQQQPGTDIEVYLVYGDNIGVGERIRTDYQGNFKFEYLRPGNYKVYVYSKDTTGTSASQDLTLVQNVDLSSNTHLPPFVIALEDKRNPDEGKFSITGKLFANFYNRNYTIKTSSGYLMDEDIYLIKDGSDPLVYEKETSMPDGSFVFSELSAGNYTVYAVSQDTTHGSAAGLLKSERKVTITDNSVNIG